MTEEEASALRVGDVVWIEEPPGEWGQGTVSYAEPDDNGRAFVITIDWADGAYCSYTGDDMSDIYRRCDNPRTDNGPQKGDSRRPPRRA